MTPGTAYGCLLIAGVVVSLTLWLRLARRDERLVLIYVAALAGAFLGAKLVFVGAEGWLHWHDPDRWLVLVTGKSITGALLGGYAGVELAKWGVGYKAPTGDWFALITPAGICLGRVGCLLHGCCLGQLCTPAWFTIQDAAGVARWPAALAELIFNVVILGAFALLHRRGLLRNQLFHVYLMAYGTFRFAHEFLRDTPRLVGPFSGYHLAAAAIALLGAIGYYRRRNQAHISGSASCGRSG